jgi:hypothetical protein
MIAIYAIQHAIILPAVLVDDFQNRFPAGWAKLLAIPCKHDAIDG